MRGPATTPASIACFSPKTGPPMSRTVVKPRIRVSVASAPAMRLLKPMSPWIDSAGVGRTSIACQWASMSPGISVPPAPSITVAPGSAAIVSGLIRSISRSRTSTLTGAVSSGPLPSKTRTSSNSVTSASAGAAATARTPPGESFGTCGPPFLPRDPRSCGL